MKNSARDSRVTGDLDFLDDFLDDLRAELEEVLREALPALRLTDVEDFFGWLFFFFVPPRDGLLLPPQPASHGRALTSRRPTTATANNSVSPRFICIILPLVNGYAEHT